MYDTGKDYELYMPGVTDYNANYIRNGTASMHRIGADSSDSDFLVMYEDMLTVGKKYTLTIWRPPINREHRRPFTCSRKLA